MASSSPCRHRPGSQQHFNFSGSETRTHFAESARDARYRKFTELPPSPNTPRVLFDEHPVFPGGSIFIDSTRRGRAAPTHSRTHRDQVGRRGVSDHKCGSEAPALKKISTQRVLLSYIHFHLQQGKINSTAYYLDTMSLKLAVRN